MIPVDLEINETFNFHDATLLLISQNRGYKVHRSRLLQDSAYFERRFKNRDNVVTEALEGKEFETIYMDAEHGDVQELLEAIYYGSRLMPLKYDNENTEKIEHLLHIFTKYEAERLRLAVIRSIEDVYPTDLPSARITNPYRASTLSFTINLAKRYHLPEILRTCFYEAAFRVDNAIDLSETDSARVEKGKQDILRHVENIRDEAWTDDLICPKSNPKCLKEVRNWLMLLDFGDPLDELWDAWMLPEHRTCLPCELKLGRKLEEFLAELWRVFLVDFEIET